MKDNYQIAKASVIYYKIYKRKFEFGTIYGTMLLGGEKYLTKKDKLIRKMKTSPNNISPDEIEKVLEWEGFIRKKSNAGSHQVFKRKSDGKVFNLVLARNPVRKYQVEDLLKILEGED